MTVPGAQHPEGEAPRKEVPVDWQARSQVLERAASVIASTMFGHEWVGVDSRETAIALRDAGLLSLGLPDEEGEGQGLGYEPPSGRPGAARKGSDVGGGS